jgi:hypothetical protein
VLIIKGSCLERNFWEVEPAEGKFGLDLGKCYKILKALPGKANSTVTTCSAADM